MWRERRKSDGGGERESGTFITRNWLTQLWRHGESKICCGSASRLETQAEVTVQVQRQSACRVSFCSSLLVLLRPSAYWMSPAHIVVGNPLY